MKKSVLIALLGLGSTEGMKINSKEDSETQVKSANKAVDAANASNATQSIANTGSELVMQVAALEAKQDQFDFDQEMDEADEDAEAVIREADEADAEEERLLATEIEMFNWAPKAGAAAPALAAAAAAAPAKTHKNKDSSDEECACAPGKESTKQKAAIKAKQEKRLADAKGAKAAATAAKSAAEEAIAAANLAKRTSAKNVLELAKAAEEAISKATALENKSIEK
jgi:hypothetical protein